MTAASHNKSVGAMPASPTLPGERQRFGNPCDQSDPNATKRPGKPTSTHLRSGASWALNDHAYLHGTGRKTRRHLIQLIASASGAALLLRAGTLTFAASVLAQDEDNSGHGSDGGQGRGRGRGDREEDDDAEEGEAQLQTAPVPPGSLEVRIVSDDAGGFSPAELTAALGQSVSFVNAHDDEHTATGSGFDTGIIQPGTVATIALNTPGRFAYACQIHPEMTGSIAVRDSDGAVPESAATAAAPADATTVTIANLAFAPAQLAVQASATVVWQNRDSVPHTVTATDGAFDSGIFDPGASFSWTFDRPGTFAYACQLHPAMQGSVVVEGSPGASAAASTELAQASAQPTAPVVGTWLIALSPDNTAAFAGQTALFTFRGDGTLDADFSSASPSSEPKTTLGAGHGEWAQQDDHFSIVLAALLTDEENRFSALITFDGEATVNTTDGHLDGAFTFTTASAGDGTTQEGVGSLSGQKLPLDP